MRRGRRSSSPPVGTEIGREPPPTPCPAQGVEGHGTRLLVLGEFGRPHGLGGEMRLKSYTDDPLAISRYGPLLAADGRSFVITQARAAAGDQPDLLVVRVQGVASRDAAEPLNRLRLHIERERLGQPDEDEFYLADLVGLRAETSSGIVGEVIGIPNFGGGELLEIAPAAGGPTVLLPFTKAFVPTVDVAGGRVVIEPPHGFMEEADHARG